MDAKSPVVGSKLPIFSPEFSAGEVVGVGALGQPASRNPVAMVVVLRAKVMLILGMILLPLGWYLGV